MPAPTLRFLLAAGVALAAACALGAAPAGAHTDSDVVAVPAASQATVKLEPTHGCGDSPTVEVSVRAPIASASAGDVPGWIPVAIAGNETDPAAASTTLTWSGGSLPADQDGSFPVTFTVPDTPGELIVFPSVQRCANGEVLRWISGDPASEFPAPRVLVLPRGSRAAATIDDVPAGTPGRELLTQIVDVDDPDATTTVPPTSEAPSSATSTTEAQAGDAPERADEADPEEDDALASAIPWIVLVVLVAVGTANGVRTMRRRRRGIRPPTS